MIDNVRNVVAQFGLCKLYKNIIEGIADKMVLIYCIIFLSSNGRKSLFLYQIRKFILRISIDKYSRVVEKYSYFLVIRNHPETLHDKDTQKV